MRIPAFTSADSKVKLHPSRNETMSSRQTWDMSVGSSTSSPYSKTRYLGRSVLRSAPGAIVRGSDDPTSTTSSRGHGLGLRWQKSRKSNACSLGRITRLACTRPGAIPLVRPLNSPLPHHRPQLARRGRQGCYLLHRSTSILSGVPLFYHALQCGPSVETSSQQLWCS